MPFYPTKILDNERAKQVSRSLYRYLVWVRNDLQSLNFAISVLGTKCKQEAIPEVLLTKKTVQNYFSRVL